MIVITGAAGFIGSVTTGHFNAQGYNDLILVDDFSKSEKQNNYEQKKYTERIARKDFFKWLTANHKFVQLIVHLGARTDTTEFNKNIFDELNLNYSKSVWEHCVKFGLPLIYASSAATYGGGELGYSDAHAIIPQLKPLNPYGESKNDFDKWALEQNKQPYFWAGLKFFNVYGPNEYHKGRMASVVLHAFRQISETGGMKLFKSHNPNYAHGGQLRDFIYVKDVADVIFYLSKHRQNSGIYNLGTGVARPFINLAQSVFNAVSLPENIQFIDTPEDIRDKYQYYTQADMEKLRAIGYTREFTSLEKGIDDYVKNYLATNNYL